MASLWARFLAAGALVVVVQWFLPYGLLGDSIIVAAGAAGVVAMVVGVRRYRPARPLPWYLMAAGVAFWATGDGLWTVFDHVLGIDPFPSGADVAYLVAYPLFGVGLHLLARGKGRATDRSALLDALIVAVSVGLVLWVVFIAPTWTDAEGSTLGRFVGVAYPIGDLVLVTQLAHLTAARTSRTPALRLLGVGFVVIFVADLLFQAAAYVPVLDENIGWLDPLWMLAYLFWGAAALHPSLRATGEHERGPQHTLTPRRVAYLALAVAVLPGLVLVERSMGLREHNTEVTFASLPLIALVIARMLGMVRRMQEQADRLAHLADTDFLTGLENARRLSSRVDALIRPAAGGSPQSVALLLVAVERFTEINDTLGLRTGDQLLRAVGARLTTAVDADGVVARLGGESFGILLPGVASGQRAAERAAEVRAAFEEPFHLPELTVTVDVAVGIALAPGDAGTAADLLQRADVALSAARERRDLVASYAEQMHSGGPLTPVLMSELLAALEQDHVVVHFQPQVELRSGRVLGVEALVRWEHPVHGMLGPLAFVPAAERTGLIRQLTLHVLDRSLAQAAAWRADGRTISVSVNLSVRNLLDPHFVEDVRAALERHRIPARQLELEVTETMAMLDPHRSVEVLGALDALGVTLSVDDYGTGYSSLAYLQRLPLQRLKIDRSFVAGVVTDDASAAIVRSTIELARHLGLSVVAEGVEDDETMLALLGMRCFAAQGFGLGRPVPADRIPAMIDEIEGRVAGVVGARVPVQRGA
ncbi:GGDEF domain-containing protein [Actinotalea ferrariae]|uniref:putative bifunctional diguanylate cyclase/phosphodiesterase n=1 Tax=Actinotalea ferrariae TaxID=1386098 RepID=UPI001C8BCC34|nr:bifunctional diguanylate cyclase/phosphodiesterase [Actinotalea ferrariae]MBX9244246.1 GGDEF domain-containing protein [Actinotalea ferrariae]